MIRTITIIAMQQKRPKILPPIPLDVEVRFDVVLNSRSVSSVSDAVDVRVDRVGNTFAVVTFAKFRYQKLPLQAADNAVGKFVFEVFADLGEIFPVVDRDEKQGTRIVVLFGADLPPASYGDRVIVDLAIAGRFYDGDGDLDGGICGAQGFLSLVSSCCFVAASIRPV